MNKNTLIAIAGGTAAGKSTLAKQLCEALPVDTTLIHMDDFFKELSHLTDEQIREYNWDHPSSLRWEVYIRTISKLCNGNERTKPVYDFEQNGVVDTETVEPAPVIVTEGLWTLREPEITDRAAVKIYVECDADIRLARRIERDSMHRGMDVSRAVEEWTEHAKPMHEEYVEPTKDQADIVVPGDFDKQTVDFIASGVVNDEFVGTKPGEWKEMNPSATDLFIDTS